MSQIAQALHTDSFHVKRPLIPAAVTEAVRVAVHMVVSLPVAVHVAVSPPVSVRVAVSLPVAVRVAVSLPVSVVDSVLVRLPVPGV